MFALHKHKECTLDAQCFVFIVVTVCSSQSWTRSTADWVILFCKSTQLHNWMQSWRKKCVWVLWDCIIKQWLVKRCWEEHLETAYLFCLCVCVCLFVLPIDNKVIHSSFYIFSYSAPLNFPNPSASKLHGHFSSQSAIRLDSHRGKWVHTEQVYCCFTVSFFSHCLVMKV